MKNHEDIFKEAQQYSDILKRYEENGEIFTDPNFLPTSNIQESKFVYNEEKCEWHRIDEFYTAPLFKKEAIKEEAIQQGQLEDSYLIASLARIAKQPELVELLFDVRTKSNEENGNAEFIDTINLKCGAVIVYFFLLGKRTPILIDTLIPFQQGTQIPLFSRPSDSSFSPWFCLVEKAYAKLHESYSAIVDGKISQAMYQFFNYYPSYKTFDLILQKHKLKLNPNYKPNSVTQSSPEERQKDMEYLFSLLMKWQYENAVIAADIPLNQLNKGVTPEEIANKGLILSHTYLILKARKEDDKKFICLKSPLNDHEWTGDWSRTSSLWTDEMKKKLGFHRKSGTFWMTDTDFFKYFSSFDVAKPVNPLDHSKSFTVKLIPGENDGSDIDSPEMNLENRQTFAFKPKAESQADSQIESQKAVSDVKVHVTVEKRSPFSATEPDSQIQILLVFSQDNKIEFGKLLRYDRQTVETRAFFFKFTIHIKETQPFVVIVHRSDKKDFAEEIRVSFTCKNDFDLFDVDFPDKLCEENDKIGVLFDNKSRRYENISRKIAVKNIDGKEIRSLESDEKDLTFCDHLKLVPSNETQSGFFEYDLSDEAQEELDIKEEEEQVNVNKEDQEEVNEEQKNETNVEEKVDDSKDEQEQAKEVDESKKNDEIEPQQQQQQQEEGVNENPNESQKDESAEQPQQEEVNDNSNENKNEETTEQHQAEENENSNENKNDEVKERNLENENENKDDEVKEQQQEENEIKEDEIKERNLENEIENKDNELQEQQQENENENKDDELKEQQQQKEENENSNEPQNDESKEQQQEEVTSNSNEKEEANLRNQTPEDMDQMQKNILSLIEKEISSFSQFTSDINTQQLDINQFNDSFEKINQISNDSNLILEEKIQPFFTTVRALVLSCMTQKVSHQLEYLEEYNRMTSNGSINQSKNSSKSSGESKYDDFIQKLYNTLSIDQDEAGFDAVMNSILKLKNENEELRKRCNELEQATQKQPTEMQENDSEINQKENQEEDAEPVSIVERNVTLENENSEKEGQNSAPAQSTELENGDEMPWTVPPEEQESENQQQQQQQQNQDEQINDQNEKQPEEVADQQNAKNQEDEKEDKAQSQQTKAAEEEAQEQNEQENVDQPENTLENKESEENQAAADQKQEQENSNENETEQNQPPIQSKDANTAAEEEENAPKQEEEGIVTNGDEMPWTLSPEAADDLLNKREEEQEEIEVEFATSNNEINQTPTLASNINSGEDQESSIPNAASEKSAKPNQEEKQAESGNQFEPDSSKLNEAKDEKIENQFQPDKENEANQPKKEDSINQENDVKTEEQNKDEINNAQQKQEQENKPKTEEQNKDEQQKQEIKSNSQNEATSNKENSGEQIESKQTTSSKENSESSVKQKDQNIRNQSKQENKNQSQKQKQNEANNSNDDDIIRFEPFSKKSKSSKDEDEIIKDEDGDPIYPPKKKSEWSFEAEDNKMNLRPVFFSSSRQKKKKSSSQNSQDGSNSSFNTNTSIINASFSNSSIHQEKLSDGSPKSSLYLSVIETSEGLQIQRPNQNKNQNQNEQQNPQPNLQMNQDQKQPQNETNLQQDQAVTQQESDAKSEAKSDAKSDAKTQDDENTEDEKISPIVWKVTPSDNPERPFILSKEARKSQQDQQQQQQNQDQSNQMMSQNPALSSSLLFDSQMKNGQTQNGSVNSSTAKTEVSSTIIFDSPKQQRKQQQQKSPQTPRQSKIGLSPIRPANSEQERKLSRKLLDSPPKDQPQKQKQQDQQQPAQNGGSQPKYPPVISPTYMRSSDSGARARQVSNDLQQPEKDQEQAKDARSDANTDHPSEKEAEKTRHTKETQTTKKANSQKSKPKQKEKAAAKKDEATKDQDKKKEENQKTNQKSKPKSKSKPKRNENDKNKDKEREKPAPTKSRAQKLNSDKSADSNQNDQNRQTKHIDVTKTNDSSPLSINTSPIKKPGRNRDDHYQYNANNNRNYDDQYQYNSSNNNRNRDDQYQYKTNNNNRNRDDQYQYKTNNNNRNRDDQYQYNTNNNNRNYDDHYQMNSNNNDYQLNYQHKTNKKKQSNANPYYYNDEYEGNKYFGNKKGHKKVTVDIEISDSSEDEVISYEPKSNKYKNKGRNRERLQPNQRDMYFDDYNSDLEIFSPSNSSDDGLDNKLAYENEYFNFRIGGNNSRYANPAPRRTNEFNGGAGNQRPRQATFMRAFHLQNVPLNCSYLPARLKKY